MIALIFAIGAVIAVVLAILLRRRGMYYLAAIGLAIAAAIDAAALYGLVSSELWLYNLESLTWSRPVWGFVIAAFAVLFAQFSPTTGVHRR